MTAGRTNHTAFANAKREHQFEKHTNCELQHCQICDGGLQFCTVCRQGEADLAEECPGAQQQVFDTVSATVLRDKRDAAIREVAILTALCAAADLARKMNYEGAGNALARMILELKV